jgi:hypothetical protein
MPQHSGPLPTTAAALAADQFLATRLDGADVYNAANEKVADVEDLILTSQGHVIAVILGYGGLAGIGRGYVAVPPTQLQVRRDGEDLRVQTSMSIEELRRAQQFTYTARTR